MNALALAFGLLTVVPVRRLPDVDRRQAGRAMLLAPLTTLPLVVALLLAHLAARAVPALVAAVVVLGAGALLTRGLHLDGLADTADGLSMNGDAAGGHSVTGDAAARLRVMKASDIGPSGVTALVLVLLLQSACLADLLPTWPGTALAAVAWPASRHALAWACQRSVPSASDGLGALVAGTVRIGACVSALVVLLLLAALVTLPTWWTGPVVVLVALVAAGIVVRLAVARLGGITGDVLGASVEVALAAGLLAAVAAR